MGVSPTLTPNWRNFVEGGTFLPNLPLLRHIRAEVQQNENIIDFANGELGCNLYPHDQLQTILREQPLTHALSYDHPQGYLPLRQTVVKYMKEYLKVEATEQSIMITSGAQQALHLIVQCLLNPGDAVAFEVHRTVIPYRYSNQQVFVFSHYLSMNTVLIRTMCKSYIESIVLK